MPNLLTEWLLGSNRSQNTTSLQSHHYNGCAVQDETIHTFFCMRTACWVQCLRYSELSFVRLSASPNLRQNNVNKYWLMQGFYRSRAGQWDTTCKNDNISITNQIFFQMFWRKWATFQTTKQKPLKVYWFIWEIWWPIWETKILVPYPGECQINKECWHKSVNYSGPAFVLSSVLSVENNHINESLTCTSLTLHNNLQILSNKESFSQG